MYNIKPPAGCQRHQCAAAMAECILLKCSGATNMASTSAFSGGGGTTTRDTTTSETNRVLSSSSGAAASYGSASLGVCCSALFCLPCVP